MDPCRDLDEKNYTKQNVTLSRKELFRIIDYIAQLNKVITTKYLMNTRALSFSLAQRPETNGNSWLGPITALQILIPTTLKPIGQHFEYCLLNLYTNSYNLWFYGELNKCCGWSGSLLFAKKNSQQLTSMAKPVVALHFCPFTDQTNIIQPVN